MLDFSTFDAALRFLMAVATLSSWLRAMGDGEMTTVVEAWKGDTRSLRASHAADIALSVCSCSLVSPASPQPASVRDALRRSDLPSCLAALASAAVTTAELRDVAVQAAEAKESLSSVGQALLKMRQDGLRLLAVASDSALGLSLLAAVPALQQPSTPRLLLVTLRVTEKRKAGSAKAALQEASQLQPQTQPSPPPAPAAVHSENAAAAAVRDCSRSLSVAQTRLLKQLLSSMFDAVRSELGIADDEEEQTAASAAPLSHTQVVTAVSSQLRGIVSSFTARNEQLQAEHGQRLLDAVAAVKPPQISAAEQASAETAAVRLREATAEAERLREAVKEAESRAEQLTADNKRLQQQVTSRQQLTASDAAVFLPPLAAAVTHCAHPQCLSAAVSAI